jgi:Domain of unknown function (DUF2828)
LSPKSYRKLLVTATQVVETQMCAKQWDEIDYNHVPSLASARYKKAFGRHSPEKFKAYTDALVRGDKGVKVNAGAVYPYDILKGLKASYGGGWGQTKLVDKYSPEERNHIKAQWDALPNYVGDASILPIVDVSSSMECKAGGRMSKSNTTCLDVSVSLGLYLADKNRGVFKDTFMTFSNRPSLFTIKGDILQKADQLIASEWGGNTNLHAALDLILKTAVDHKVSQEDMPQTLMILSDMQFDYCVQHDDSAIEMIRRKYEKAGYTLPRVVFWNLNATYDNVPVKYDESGTALVSGFSPSIMKSVLAAKDFNPE